MRQTLRQWRYATGCDGPEEAGQKIRQLQADLARLQTRLEEADDEARRAATGAYGKHEFTVVDCGSRKIDVIKAIRSCAGMGLMGAKEASEGAAFIPPPECARRLRAELEALGADVRVRTLNAGAIDQSVSDDRGGAYERGYVDGQRVIAELLSTSGGRLSLWSGRGER